MWPAVDELAGKSKMVFGELTERKKLERAMRDAGRLPPGQSLTLKWPVLHVGDVPRFDAQTWDFRISGLVEEPLRLAWDEFTRLISSPRLPSGLSRP